MGNLERGAVFGPFRALYVEVVGIKLHVDGNEGLHRIEIEPYPDLGHRSNLHTAQIDGGTDGETLNISPEVSNGVRVTAKEPAAAEDHDRGSEQAYGAERECADDGGVGFLAHWDSPEPAVEAAGPPRVRNSRTFALSDSSSSRRGLPCAMGVRVSASRNR